MSLRKRMLDDLDQDIREHIEIETSENIERGMTPEAARYAALRKFGNPALVKEEVREMWGWTWLERLAQDLRYGLRQLRRSPGFTAVAIVTLALGIGATTAIFSVVDAVLLKSAPYANPAELVEITEKGPQTAPGEVNEASAGDFTDWQQQAPVFQGLAAYEQWEFHALTGVGEPDEVWTSTVTANLFRVLGVRADRGRTFASDETQTVVLSHQYWESHLSADPKIIGKALALDGKPTLWSVSLPRTFSFPRPAPKCGFLSPSVRPTVPTTRTADSA